MCTYYYAISSRISLHYSLEKPVQCMLYKASLRFSLAIIKSGVGSTLLASLDAVEATGKHVELVGMRLLLAAIDD